MTEISLSRLLLSDSDHTVCFNRRGESVSWQLFRGAVAGIAAALAGLDGDRIAIDTDDTFEFAAAIFGCWCAAKTPVLPPVPMLAAGHQGADFNGVVAARGRGKSGRQTLWFDEIGTAAPGTSIVPPSSNVVVYTSGSTGAPTRVFRSLRSLEAELRVFESLFGETIGDGRIFSTVSHRHIYGLLFRLFWPLASQRAFARFDLEYPENLFGPDSCGNVLVTSPAILKRIGHISSPAVERWRIVFSSGGELPAAAAKDALRLLGVCPVEILGSTETSGVALRRQGERGAAEHWHALPEVRVREDDDGFLEVSSPFMGLSSWHRMGDRVRMATNRSFELLGRGDHIAKIEEKRVSLAEVEKLAGELPTIVEVAAVALEDGVRQYVGLIVQFDEAGRAELDRTGRRRTNDRIREHLKGRLEPVALPRKFRYVDEIPVNAQGKRRAAELEALFRRS